MKYDELRSIAHNVAASLASGTSFLIGEYELDVFGAAERASEGKIVVDFLLGTVSGAPAEPELARAVARFPAAFPGCYG